jgi:HEPN domain-containing protein
MRDPEATRLARHWLHNAREDLAAARSTDPSLQARHRCFLAQQAAEKALKSVLILEQIDFPFVHDLVDLQERAPRGHAIRRADLDLAPLSEWAVEGRYPQEEDATEADARQAVELAAHAVELVSQDFEREALR